MYGYFIIPWLNINFRHAKLSHFSLMKLLAAVIYRDSRARKGDKEGSGTFGCRRLGVGHFGAWTIGRQNSAPDYLPVFLA